MTQADTPQHGPQSETPQFDLSTPCYTCRHKVHNERRCSAFPVMIPDEIWVGNHKHTTPYPGDQGIRYEVAPPADTMSAVQYMELFDNRSGTPVRTGILWISTNGRAMGVFGRTDVQDVWRQRLATAWRSGGTPRDVWGYWRDWRHSMAAGQVVGLGEPKEATDLHELQKEIARTLP